MDIRQAKEEIKKLELFIKSEIEKERLKKPHCRNCLSCFGYKTKKGFVCRKCGNVTIQINQGRLKK